MSKHKIKAKTFIILHYERTKEKGCHVAGRYRVGARNKDEAENFVRQKIGKFTKVKMYYEERDKDKQCAYETVIRELGQSEEVL